MTASYLKRLVVTFPEIRGRATAPATSVPRSRDLLWNFPQGSLVAGLFDTLDMCHDLKCPTALEDHHFQIKKILAIFNRNPVRDVICGLEIIFKKFIKAKI